MRTVARWLRRLADRLDPPPAAVTYFHGEPGFYTLVPDAVWEFNTTEKPDWDKPL